MGALKAYDHHGEATQLEGGGVQIVVVLSNSVNGRLRRLDDRREVATSGLKFRD
jgi:hypothetical protein